MPFLCTEQTFVSAASELLFVQPQQEKERSFEFRWKINIMLQKVTMHFDRHRYKPPDKSIGAMFFGGLSDYI